MIERLNAALQDRYAVERELGQGGMATVFLAEDVRHKRKVALKVLKPELAAVVGGERFLTEIETTARLQHPNILPLFDSGEAGGFLFYVMPFVEGETLRDRLDRETHLPVDEAVRIATEVAEALHSAHGQGVIHRDIKPANVMMSQGHPLVADFGIALAVSAAGGHRLTETGLSLGTPHYMSPEQATGDQAVGPASDIYSLGCVLYEMLVGEPPYTGSTAQAILGKIITSDPESVTAQRRAVLPHVDAVVARALEKLPADRFTSVADFAAALGDSSFRHGPGGTNTVGVSDAWKRATLATAAGLVVVSGLAVMGWLRPGPPQPVIRYPLAQTEQERFTPGFGPSLALSPDGSRLAYLGTVGDTAPGLWIKERDAAHAREIPGTEYAEQPFFLPDGNHLGFILAGPGPERSVRVVSLENGGVVTLADTAFYKAGASPSPGEGIYIMGAHFGIARLSESTGELEPVTNLLEGEAVHYLPDLLPSGRGLLFTVGATQYDFDGAAVAVVDLDSGEHRILVEDAVLGRHAATGHLLFVRRDGTLWAAPFDEKALRLTGEAVPLFGNILVGTGQDQDWSVDLTLSETGTLVYTTREPVEEGTRYLQWVSRAGETQTIDSEWGDVFESVTLSPDESRLAVTVGSFDETDVWIKDLEQGPRTPVTFTTGMNRRPEWLPDGRTVSYITDQAGNRDVFGRMADGTGSAEALFDLDVDVDEAVWSGDRQWLAYRTGTTDGNRDIFAWRVGTDPASVVTISAIPGVDETSPTLSPDGRFIAYASDERNPGVRTDVWVRPFPNVEDGKWQISTGGGIEPLWAPDGTELFYVRYGAGVRTMVSVPVRTTPSFSRGEESGLFPMDPYMEQALHRGYDVTADGQRFVMVRRAAADAGTEIIVVENFFEELKRRAPHK